MGAFWTHTVLALTNSVQAWAHNLSLNAAGLIARIGVYQATNCVDGAWSRASSGWAGAISGYAGATSYAGQFSFERTAAGGGNCSAAGDINGPVTGNTLHWTAAGLTAVGPCAGDVPQSLVIDLRRQ